MRQSSSFLLLAGLCLSAANGAQLKQARVSQVIKDVKLLPAQAAPRPAVVSDEVREGTAVRTGIESRAELTFTDQTLARLGANTIFSFTEGTRNLDLGGGAMLLRVPKNSGGAKIHTAAVTAAITGTTVLLEYHPNAFIKFIVLEGVARMFRKNRVGESVLVHAGQMLIVNPNGEGLPEPVDVDLERLIKTSLLINGFPPLLSLDLIDRQIATQRKALSEGDLVNTNLVIFGGGTGVSLLDPTNANLIDQANANEERQPSEFPSHSPTPGPSPSPSPSASPSPSTSPTPSPQPTPDKFGPLMVISSPDPYVISSGTTITTDPTITTNGVTDYGSTYRGPDLDGPASLWLFGSTSDFENMIGFDQNIFISDRLPLAAFKFSALSLIGDPTVVFGAGGPNNLALISVGDLTSGPPGGVLDFSNLNFLFLATQDGSITLTSDLTFQGISTFAAYARGADSTLTFDAAVTGASIVGLISEGNIAATNSLTIEETSQNASVNGLIISLLAGQAITIGQDLTLSITNTDVITNALINVLSFAGDIKVNGVNGISLTIDNTGFQIEGAASLGVLTGGNLNASGINLFLDNNEGGLITGPANISFNVNGTLTTDDFAFVNINNGDTGGTLGASALLDLSAGAMSIGGTLDVNILNNGGGSIAGDALLSVETSGDLTTGADSGFAIDNSIFNNEGLVVGGEIGSNAAISLLAANVTAGGALFTFLYNDGGGHIGGDADIAAAITGNLTTQGVLFFDVQNSADTDGETTLPGGTIDGNATVAVAVGGDIVTQGLGEFAVLNNDFRFLSLGGTIGGDATVSLTAGGISTNDYFQPLVNNNNGVIGGGASVTVGVTGDISVGEETFFSIVNNGGSIGTNALSTFTANNFTSGNTFLFQIVSAAGAIGGDAMLTGTLTGDLTIQGDAFIRIINGSGTIGGDADISVNATNLEAISLTTLIDNTGGTIGGGATINSTYSGTVTVSNDATFNILGSDAAAGGAAINFNGGTYGVGGTFLSTTDGDGSITFNNASVNADVLKVGALGTNGALTIGGGTLSGDTELKLYASGSNGTINFISNVSLNSNSSVIIAANAVTINNGVVVTITGDDGVNASVFTNIPNYTGSGGNGSTTGIFSGNGATTAPLDQAPPFDDPPNGSTKGSTSAPGPVNQGGGANGLPSGRRRHAPVVRVSDSNALLDLADNVTSGSPNVQRNRSHTQPEKNAPGPRSGSSINRRALPLAERTPDRTGLKLP